MFAVIAHGGKQYRVAPGDVVRLEKVAGDAGGTVEAGSLLLLENDGELRFGSALGSAKVVGTIVGHERGPKLVVFKKKRCKQFRKTRGHRQDYTDVRIERIG